MDRVRQRVQVHREPVVGRGLPGHLQAGPGGRARVGHPFHSVDPAVLVAERGRGHDRRAGRDPDLETGLGERVVLPPHQLGRHRPSSPCVACVLSCAASPGPRQSTGRIDGIRSWKVRPLAGLPRAVIVQPAARAVHLRHDLGGVGAAAGERVAGEFLAVGLVDEPAERVLHLLEGLAGEGVHGEDDLVDVDRARAQVDEDRLVVAALADAADEVVAGVAHRAVVAHQVAEEDDVDRLLVGEQNGGGVEVDLPGTRAEQAAAGGRLPAETHADRGQAAAVVLLQTDGLTLGHVDGHALIPLSDFPCCRGTAVAQNPTHGH